MLKSAPPGDNNVFEIDVNQGEKKGLHKPGSTVTNLKGDPTTWDQDTTNKVFGGQAGKNKMNRPASGSSPSSSGMVGSANPSSSKNKGMSTGGNPSHLYLKRKSF